MNSDTYDRCVAAAFMMEGMMEAGYSKVVHNQDMGVLEMVQHLAQQADVMINNMETYDHDASGIYEYDVCNPFGKWFGEYVIDNGRVPSDSDCRTKIIQIHNEYFVPPEDDDPGWQDD